MKLTARRKSGCDYIDLMVGDEYVGLLWLDQLVDMPRFQLAVMKGELPEVWVEAP